MNSKAANKATSSMERTKQEAMHNRNRNVIAALNGLMKDAALAKHRKTFDEIARVMTRSLENDQRLNERLQELQSELNSKEDRVKLALQMSERDKSVIETLQNELRAASDRMSVKHRNAEGKGDGTKAKADKSDKIREDKVGADAAERKLQKMAKDRDRLLNEIEKLKLQVFELEEELVSQERSKSKESDSRRDNIREAEMRADEAETKLVEMAEDYDRLVNENEKIKLQMLELEKDLVNKEKSAKELSKSLNLKSQQLEDATEECEKLRTSNKKKKSGKSKTEFELKQIIDSLHMKLQDNTGRDQLSLGRISNLTRKNKLLYKELQTANKQHHLMKIQLDEQRKMLNLLSGQYCKLEERDNKQALTIKELEKIRNKYVNLIGNLEQEIHEMKKKSKHFHTHPSGFKY